MSARCEAGAAALVDWAIAHALPMWATAGFDAEHQRFEERLTLAGDRLPEVPVRLLSQARQVHAYAVASRRGWYGEARSLSERAFASMVRDYHRADGADGWVYSINRDGSVADGRRDFYSHAFVLLAIASHVGATGRTEALALADRTLAFLDGHMAAPGGGYVEQLPPAGAIRRQNPHMHLFEGLLALWEATRDGRYLARLDGLFDLFASRFFDAGAGTLGEYFTDDLVPVAGEAGGIVEPGHHYEWVWLLRRFEQVADRRVQPYVDALYAHADRHGFDAKGMVRAEVAIDGTPRAGGRRAWPVAEAIRANLVEATLGREQGESRALRLVEVLRQRFLTREPAGGWLDRLDGEGRPASRFMPASTLYHLIGAVDELARYAAPRRAAAD